MADTQETLFDFLKKEGYLPSTEGTPGILFKKEGRSFFTFPDAQDPTFFNLYSYFDFADQITSRAVALEAANDVNKSVKALIVTLPDDGNPSRIGFGIEAMLPTAESYKEIFDRALNTILYGVDQFAQRLKARSAN